jgi:RNA polymerase sigma-70 factor (ECF subfamily)
MAMKDDKEETMRLVRRAADGDQEGWSELADRYRGRLQRMVLARLDRRLRRRVEASDIVQEACIEAAQHLADYLSDPKMPFYLWLRGIAGNKMLELHRHHLGVQMRDAKREVAIDNAPGMQSTAVGLAAVMVANDTRPSQAAMREEMKHRLEEALASLDPIDRDVLALRHYEQLSNRETAELLGIEPAAASKRYVRALKRMKDLLMFRGDGSLGT